MISLGATSRHESSQDENGRKYETNDAVDDQRAERPEPHARERRRGVQPDRATEHETPHLCKETLALLQARSKPKISLSWKMNLEKIVLS